MTTDQWVAAALADDVVVVELLFRLKQSAAALQQSRPPLMAPLGWGCRQRRSKPAASAVRKDREFMRCSPTTPLSWSCGGGSSTSPSDGYDDTSRPSDLSSGGRSKGTCTNDSIATGTSNKRSKRKKTFSELQEEESLLLKERTHLKNELATMHVTLKKQKARSENLKTLTLDLHQQSENKMESRLDDLKAFHSYGPSSAEASKIDYVPPSNKIIVQDNHTVADFFKAEQEVETKERCFILPDLNMMPYEEDSSIERLYGFS